MDDLPAEKPVPDDLRRVADRVVARIAAVWVWTVLFATSAALTYTVSYSSSWQVMQMIGQRGGRFGPGVDPSTAILAVATPLLIGTGAVALALGWLAQYRYFRGYIIQVVILDRPSADDEARRSQAMRDLARGYFLVIVAGMLRMAPDLLAGLVPLLFNP